MADTRKAGMNGMKMASASIKSESLSHREDHSQADDANAKATPRDVSAPPKKATEIPKAAALLKSGQAADIPGEDKQGEDKKTPDSEIAKNPEKPAVANPNVAIKIVKLWVPKPN